ncbi:MAG TPA: hypothetical protein VGC66_22760 [Pyrinomonadaceae bacterium]|jgi:hypothetical protein
MWLVLCSNDDLSALWAYQGLKERGLAPMELVSAEVLAHSLRWEHRLGADGTYTEITLPDGRTINNRSTRGTLNRLQAFPGYLLRARASDRLYATQEFTAFFMSWLNALPAPVLNRPTAQGLSGPWRHISEWVWLASRASLPVPRYAETSREWTAQALYSGRLVPANTPVETIIVVAGQAVCERAPAEIREGCIQLSRLSETELLGVEFVVSETGLWTFVGATPFPDLRLGGQMLLDELFSALKAGGQSAS